MELETLLTWADQHAAVFFVALLSVAAASGWFYWRSRGPWDEESPVPMLHHNHGFAIAVITSLLFAALAFAIEADGRLVAFDQRITDVVQAQLGPAMLDVLASVTRLGGSHQLVIASAVIAILLLLSRRWLLAAGFALSLIGNGLLIRIGKDYF